MLQRDLRRAGMAISADLYVSIGMLYGILVAIGIGVAGPLVLFIMHLMRLLFLVPIIVLAPFAGFGAYRLYLYYPSLNAKNRAYKIDLALPRVIGFIHAMSRSGASVVEIFRELSVRPDAGELKNEARVYMRDVEYLGHDPLTALRDLARSTPSRRLKEFLEVLAPIAETGGDIPSYFSSKWEEYQENAKADQGKFISTLELYSEMYITMIMLMPLLMLLVFALLGPLAGYSETWLYLIAYIMIPVGSVGFMVLVSMVLPEKIVVKTQRSAAVDFYRAIPMVEGGKHEQRLRSILSRSLFRQRLKDFLKKPVQVIRKEPVYILFFSVPLTVLAIFLVIIFFGFSTARITPFVVFGFVSAATPYAAVYEITQMKLGKYEDLLLDFLRAIASGIKSGLTLQASLKVASAADLGPLTTEVRRMNADIEWGSSAGEALERFEQRVRGSELISRAVRTIKKASEADEDIGDVLDILMRDVSSKRELERERKGAMGTYNIVILLMFGIFMFSMYMITGNILTLSLKSTVGSAVGGVQLFGGIDVPLVTNVFMHASILEGLFAGLVAGQASAADLRAGLKYALIMMVVAYLMFALLILPKI